MMVSDDTAVITTYYNPKNYKSRLRNYILFYQNLKRQGVNLITVECSLNNTFQTLPFKSSSNIIIPVKSQSVIWHKEHLLNRGLEYIKTQTSFKKVIFLDCDIIFLDDQWPKKASLMLDQHIIIQPYSEVIRDTRRGLGIKDDKTALEVPEGQKNGNRMYSFLSGYKQNKENDGDFGFAWGARVELFSNTNIYAGLILGGGDFLMRNCWTNDPAEFEKRYAWTARLFTSDLKADVAAYHRTMSSLINKDCGFTEGIIIHLYHGSIKDRGYGNRYEIIKLHGYNPKEDLTINTNGGLEFIGNPELEQKIGHYFSTRNEDAKKTWKLMNKKDLMKLINQKTGIIGKILLRKLPSIYKLLKPFFPDRK